MAVKFNKNGTSKARNSADVELRSAVTEFAHVWAMTTVSWVPHNKEWVGEASSVRCGLILEMLKCEKVYLGINKTLSSVAGMKEKAIWKKSEAQVSATFMEN